MSAHIDVMYSVLQGKLHETYLYSLSVFVIGNVVLMPLDVSKGQVSFFILWFFRLCKATLHQSQCKVYSNHSDLLICTPSFLVLFVFCYWC